MLGGKVAVMKGLNRLGRRVNGSVGKSFAYGAQRGRLFVQGDADSRFCIRLSGRGRGDRRRARGAAAGRLAGCLADRANIKGFAFEYMTAGRAVVLGDPGPWFCAGQTGGRVYLRVNHEWGLDREALERRKGKGAKVAMTELDVAGRARRAGAARGLRRRARGERPGGRGGAHAGTHGEPQRHFLVCVPEREQTDPSVSTE